MTGNRYDSIRSLTSRSDDDAGGLWLMLEQTAVVPVQAAELVGKPALAEHQDPRVLPRG